MFVYQKAKTFARGRTINSIYSPLSTETLLSSPDYEKQDAKSIPQNGNRPLLTAIWVIGLIFWTVATFLVGSQFRNNAACALETATWSPAISLIRYQDVKIEGDFFKPSPYRGAGDDVDRAWDELWMIGGVPIRIDDNELALIHKSSKRNWTRIPDSRGGGIAGYPEVFHQLHCLNMLRMASYPEHYYTSHPFFSEHSASITRAHLDHCVEILRMQLQCTAEMTPILTEDLPGHEFPAADFNVVHKCKNFEELYAWTKENVLHGAGNWDIPTFPDDHAG
ncbi:hypothetical protein F5X99DRAFT_409448 [Biscogniauxia marginata]|nr:hypothetical protein F5X99DRAFT_409448 [Biscogniauxia marginata]